MVLRKPFMLAVVLLFAVQAGLARAGTVTVQVSALRSDRGVVLIAICDAESFLTRFCPYFTRARAAAGTLIVDVEGVEDGSYAVQVIHDENDNRQFDRNFLGIPGEGYGFSNDAIGLFYSPPDFADAAIEVAGDAVKVQITLRYLIDE